MNQLSYNASNKRSLEKGFAYVGDLDTSLKLTVDKLSNAKSIVKKN